MRRSISFLGFALVLALGMVSFRKSANSLEVITTDAGQVSGELVVIDHHLCLANLGGGLRAHLDVLVEREDVEAGLQFFAVGRRRRQRQEQEH